MFRVNPWQSIGDQFSLGGTVKVKEGLKVEQMPLQKPSPKPGK